MILSVIIPAYNEESSIKEILRQVFDVPVMKEVIVVNDASKDKTKEILNQFESEYKDGKNRSPHVKNIKVIHKETNQGKGAAIRTGLDYVDGDIVVIQDADLEMDPKEYPKLIEPFNLWGADVVFGSRFRMEGPKRIFRFWHYMINRGFTIFSNMLSDLKLTDMWTCYKVFRTPVLKSFTIESNRFGFEPEMVAKVAKGDFAIYEVSVTYKARSWSQGKKIGFKDGIEAIWVIIKYNLFR